MPFTFKRLDIPDVVLIGPRVFGDERGFFLETYKRSEFSGAGIRSDFVQGNHSRSKKGVLRGLHFQLAPRAQGKLVRVVCGAVFDVAVDIRKGSPWFGRWAGAVLSGENRLMLWVPPGFAHGFLTLEDDTDVLYSTTDEYSPEHESGIAWNDPEIAIKWPAEIKNGNPEVSDRDARLPLLRETRNDFIYAGGEMERGGEGGIEEK
ncbi:MAG: dTDP-4-dehydrorhamnose 3,5-epimerase [Nitrospiraceae bacterium]|nr:dTDP-4-dehydrorhamnose 3,5-epimerase [Nitrospiraceae bacterium]